MLAVNLTQCLIRKTTFACLQRYIRRTNLELVENIVQKDEEAYNSEMSIIMLWGEIGSITLKVHFSLDIASALSSKTSNVSIEKIESQLAKEFIKEFSNHQGGYLKGFFEKSNFVMGMSLPFLARGVDEIIFRKIRDPRASFDVFKINIDDLQLFLTSEICLIDSSAIEKSISSFEVEIEKCSLPQKIEDDGVIDFF